MSTNPLTYLCSGVLLFKTLTMHKNFANQSVYLYPERIEGINIRDLEVWPMKFDNGLCDFEQASECPESEAEFYSVFVLIPLGRDTIAECATKELADQLENTLLSVGKHFIQTV